MKESARKKKVNRVDKSSRPPGIFSPCKACYAGPQKDASFPIPSHEHCPCKWGTGGVAAPTTDPPPAIKDHVRLFQTRRTSIVFVNGGWEAVQAGLLPCPPLQLLCTTTTPHLDSPSFLWSFPLVITCEPGGAAGSGPGPLRMKLISSMPLAELSV